MAARKRGKRQRRRPAARTRASGRRRAKARVSPKKRARSGARRATTRRRAPRKATGKASRRRTARKAARRPAKRAARAARPPSRPATTRTPTTARAMLPAVPEVVQTTRSASGGPKEARAKAPLGMSRGKTPRLERERRILSEPDRMETPKFDPDERMLQSARTGHDELRQALRDHTATGPELTGGDIDANWQDAYAVGDEAPGGDNPTPDQDRVDDIGRSLGVTYEDNEELKGADKIAERDRKRWEFDPASSDDWPRKE